MARASRLHGGEDGCSDGPWRGASAAAQQYRASPARPLAMERIVEGTEAGLETLRMPRGLVVGVAGPAQRGNEQRDRRRRPRHPIKLRVGSKGRGTEWADGRDQTSVLLLACASSRDTRCSIAPEAAPVIGPRVDGPGRAWTSGTEAASPSTPPVPGRPPHHDSAPVPFQIVVLGKSMDAIRTAAGAGTLCVGQQVGPLHGHAPEWLADDGRLGINS